MENFDNLTQNNVALEVTENSKTYLKSAAAWCKFLAILNFIGIGCMALGGSIAILPGSLVGSYTPVPVPMALLGFVYLALAVILFFPALYLYRFSTKTPLSLATNNVFELEDALKDMKSYWKFRGILAIVAIAFCIFIIPIIVIAALASSGAFVY
jgi:hypothetical protein